VTGVQTCALPISTDVIVNIRNCYATGNITGSSTYIGGLVGNVNNASAKIDNCYASGNVSGTNYVGGLVGNTPGAIQNCVAANALITATAGTVLNRIAGTGGTYYNNYAFEGMKLFASGVEREGSGTINTAGGA
jgi:hypothetical protein